MPKVYIASKGCHDYSDAERFGDFVYLSDDAINRYAVSNMYREFMPILLESSPEDYILLTGLSVMNSVACSIFAHLHGRINLLLYKATSGRGKGRYVERIVMIGDD